MKRFIIVFFIIITFFSCKRSTYDLNILTDDILLYDFAQEFNAKHENNVHINYIKCDDDTLFNKYDKMEIKNIDILVGTSNLLDTFDASKFCNLTQKSNYTTTYSYKNRALLNNFGYFYPYSLDFNVLVTLKSTKINNTNNIVTIDNIKDFLNKNLTKEKITYSPTLSKFSILEYIFMFGGKIQENEKYINFETEQNNRIYSTYIDFDKNYNQGDEKRDMILECFVNIPRQYYLKQKIILFDVMPISKALKLPKDRYEIYFFDNTVCTTFSHKVVAMTSNNINQELSHEFIDFILSKKSQQKMFELTMNQNYNNFDIHIPITMDATDDATSDYNFIQQKYYNNLKFICNKINDPNMINYDIYKKFIDTYLFTKSTLDNGQIDAKDFLKSLTINLNK